MSHMIPIVSSSPPPFDDSFGWDDGEDDDFGNFTGADDVHVTLPDLHISPQKNDMVNQNVMPTTPQKILSAADGQVAETGHCPNDLDQNLNRNSSVVSEHADNATNGNGNFAQFDVEDVEVSSPVRPHIVGLPLGKTSDLGDSTETPELEEDTVSCESATLQESKEPNKSCNMSMRDSTTDSGMFSNDISPVPKSEDTAEFCDKTSSSDSDEPFPDFPPDGKSELTSSHSDEHIVSSKHLEVDCNSSPTSEPEIEICEENRTKSFDAVNEDSMDVVGPSSPVGCDSDEVVEESVVVNEPSVSSDISENVHINHEEQDSDECKHCPANESGCPKMSDDEDSMVDSGKLPGVDIRINPDNQISSDVDHPEINPTSDSEPDVICDDDDDDVRDAPLHSNKIIDTKDLKNSTEEQVIPSITDLSQDTLTFHSVEEHLAESSNGSVSQNQESVLPDSEVSTDSAEGADLSRHHSDQNLNKTDVENDPDITFDDDHCQSGTSLPENQWTSENKNNSAKPSSDSCGSKSGDYADDSFGGFAAFNNTSDGDNDAGNEDWASFQSIGHCESTVDQPLDLPSISQEADDEEDDFGDFIDNVAVKGDQVKDSAVGSSDQDDVEAFSGKDDGDCEEEEWANFEEPQGDDSEFTQVESELAPETTVKYKDISEKLAALLSKCFQAPSIEYGGMTDFTPTILECVISQDVSQQSDKKRGLDDFTKKIWNQLIDLDKTPALVYHWSSSSGNSNIFKTLRIDTQNILLGHKKQTVPIFASNMGLLEPIRGPIDTKKETTKTEPALVDPSKAESPMSENQDIPPVEFDWHNSGLTNPLAAKTLDLDFLTEQESESAGKTTDEWDWVFQSEVLDAPRTSVKSLPPLEDVLKNVKLTTTKTKKSETLHPEARRIIDSLPLLSFMHAKVLMFPFRQEDN